MSVEVCGSDLSMMSFPCIPCDRAFVSQSALDQHLRDSPAHATMHDCDPCNRSFASQDALDQHLRDSPAHATLRDSLAHATMYNCDPCDRAFVSQDALDQHLRNSPAHATTYDCDPCDRAFVSQDALDQHLRNSPAHATTYDCDPCDRAFVSQDALDQHLRDSPAHATTYNCNPCDRVFVSQDALDQHLRDSQSHQQAADTPLNTFFRSFATFHYDPTLAPSLSFANLRKHKGWRHGQAESNDAWDDYQLALENELRKWYGSENDLTAWHALCRAIGIVPLPTTCEQCEKAARRTHVNIVDLIEWARSDQVGQVHTFRDVAELRSYTKRTGKIFRNTFDGRDENVVLRHLLRKIFRASL